MVSTVPLRLRGAGNCVPASSAKGEETARLLNNCGIGWRWRAAEAPGRVNPRAPSWPGHPSSGSCWGRSVLLPWHARLWAVVAPGAPAPSAAGAGEGERGLLQVLSLCRVFSPLWGVFPEFQFPLPSIAGFSRLEQSGQDLCPSILTSSDSRPLGWIKLGTTRNPRKGRGWRPRVTLIRSGIEMSRARRPSWSPPPERVTKKSHK